VRSGIGAIRLGAMLLFGIGLFYGASYLAADRFRSEAAAAAVGELPMPARGDDLLPIGRHGPSAASTAEATPDVSDSIRAAALDYIEGWYAGDAERMSRSLHPSLAKRIVERGANGRDAVSHMSAEQLIEGTRRGGGRATPAAERAIEVQVLDVFGSAATVRVDARDWIDYMHLARVDGQWVIVNVLWEYRPGV